MTTPSPQPRNPLHGITLEAMLTTLVATYGWAGLGERIALRCFTREPSIASSLKVLRKTPWAREKVERLYLFMVREMASERTDYPHTDLPPSPIPGARAIELVTGSEPMLQAFFDANPEYFLTVQGEPAAPTEARDEIHGELPTGWSFTRKWVIGYVEPNGSLIAMANLVSDILAAGVWNVSTFIVATQRHGTGEAQLLYQSLERWTMANGARWLRLGVVQGNVRGERFWESAGYVQTRLRHGVEFGSQTNTLRVMFKPLAGGSLEEYLSLVPRDRPDSVASI